jgi:sugar lactone lactonase YvrE
LTGMRVPEPWTANVCFGGKELATLFVTACGLELPHKPIRGSHVDRTRREDTLSQRRPFS